MAAILTLFVSSHWKSGIHQICTFKYTTEHCDTLKN